MSLRLLGYNRRGLSLVESPAGDELSQLHVGAHFLLHERLSCGLLVLEDLLDLRLLIICEIQLVQKHPELRSTSEASMHRVLRSWRRRGLVLRHRHTSTERQCGSYNSQRRLK